jgi:hypothetical protein
MQVKFKAGVWCEKLFSFYMDDERGGERKKIQH